VDQSNNKVSCYVTFTPRFTSLPGPGPSPAPRFIRRPFCECSRPDNKFKMKKQYGQHEEGSILLMVMMTITILTLSADQFVHHVAGRKRTTRPPVGNKPWQGRSRGRSAMNGLNTGTWTGCVHHNGQLAANRQTESQRHSVPFRKRSYASFWPVPIFIHPAFRSKARQAIRSQCGSRWIMAPLLQLRPV